MLNDRAKPAYDFYSPDQQNSAAAGFDVDFDVVEWGGPRNAPSPGTSHGDDGIDNSLGYTDPSIMYRLFATASLAPYLPRPQSARDE